MKKIFFFLMAFAAVAFAADGDVKSLNVASEALATYSILGSAIVLGLAALGGAIGMGTASSAAISGMARNPGFAGKLQTTMFIALAMIEAQVIYALVITFILLFSNPFLA